MVPTHLALILEDRPYHAVFDTATANCARPSRSVSCSCAVKVEVAKRLPNSQSRNTAVQYGICV